MFPDNNDPLCQPTVAVHKPTNANGRVGIEAAPHVIALLANHAFARECTKINFVLIDFENVQPEITNLPTGKSLRLKVFVGSRQNKIPLDLALVMQSCGSNAEYVLTNGKGTNALDSHIAYYIGFYIGSLGSQAADACFHIISRDKDYDPLIAHLNAKGIFCRRSASFAAIHFDGIAPPGSDSEKAIEVVVDKPVGRKRNRKGKRTATPIPENPGKVQTVINHLAKLHGKPGSLTTLRSTINSLFANQLPGRELQSLIEQLVLRGVLNVLQDKVTYGSNPAPEKVMAVPTFDPADPIAAATVYRDFLYSKLKCDIPSLATRQRIYQVLDTTLYDLAQKRESAALGDLSTLIAETLAISVPEASHTSVFKLLYSLYRVGAFESESSARLFHPTIFGSKKTEYSWDDLFILNCVMLMAGERSDWPVNEEALSALFEVNCETIRLITSNARLSAAAGHVKPNSNGSH